MYAVLHGAAKANMLTRNEMLDGSGDRHRFQFKDRPPRGFTVWDTWGQKRRAADVDLNENTIQISLHMGDTVSDFSATVTLNDSGRCKFRVGADELDQWQVLKRALEPLFFQA